MNTVDRARIDAQTASLLAGQIASDVRAFGAHIRHIGRTWFPEHNHRIAVEAAAFGIDPDSALGIFAALSPQREVTANYADMRACLSAWCAGQSIPFVHYGGQVSKVRRILAGWAPSDVLRGPKESPFYRALAGDADAVTVDRHIWRYVRAHIPQWLTLTERRRRVIVAAFRQAAAMLGDCARDVQAAVWEYVRPKQWRGKRS